VAAWLLSVPLMVVASQVAHVVAYRIVYPQAGVRLQMLIQTGHQYMLGGYRGYLPLLVGVGCAIELVGVLWIVFGSGGRRTRPVPAWALGVLPPLAYVIQEVTERWLLPGASFPWQLVYEPTFRVGLLLQLPFALLAAGIAYLLLRVAERVGALLSRERPPQSAPAPFVHRLRAISLPVVRPLAACHAERGPPVRLLAV